MSFTPNLNECVCSEHKGRYSEECGKHSIIFPSMEVNGAPKQPDYKLSSEYLPLCSEQTHSYRSGSTWGWVHDDRICIFGCTVPLSPKFSTKMFARKKINTPITFTLKKISIRFDFLCFPIRSKHLDRKGWPPPHPPPPPPPKKKNHEHFGLSVQGP